MTDVWFSVSPQHRLPWALVFSFLQTGVNFKLSSYDLYVAGHTHTGQLFPNRLVTKKMYKLDYGRKEFGNLTAITSNGYGFWGVPVRTEVAPELVVINLKSK